MANTALHGNPHVRFDEGEIASAKPRRKSLLDKIKTAVVFSGAVLGLLSLCGCGRMVTKDGLRISPLQDTELKKGSLNGVPGWEMRMPMDGDFEPSVVFFILNRFEDKNKVISEMLGDIENPSKMERTKAGSVDVEFVSVRFDRHFQGVMRLIKTEEKSYVVIGFTLKSQWEKYSKTIRACVKSAVSKAKPKEGESAADDAVWHIRKARQKTCQRNMQQIQSAIDQCQRAGVVPADANLYGPGKYIKVKPQCPSTHRDYVVRKKPDGKYAVFCTEEWSDEFPHKLPSFK